MYGLTVTIPPATEPISLAEAKTHLRIEHTLEDDLINSLIQAAREWCESYQGKAYINRTLALTLDAFPAGDIQIPRPPLQTVTTIAYNDVNGTPDTVDAADFVVDGSNYQGGRIGLAYGCAWPSTYGEAGDVTITYVAGYGATSAFVPATVKAAMKLLVGHWYEHRESVTDGSAMSDVPMTVMALLGPTRAMNYV